MYEDLATKLKGVRRQAISTIKNFMADNKIDEINCCDVSRNMPSATSTQDIESIAIYGKKLTFFTKGKLMSGSYEEDEVSTDCLLDVVRFIEYYDAEIIEYGSK